MSFVLSLADANIIERVMLHIIQNKEKQKELIVKRVYFLPQPTALCFVKILYIFISHIILEVLLSGEFIVNMLLF